MRDRAIAAGTLAENVRACPCRRSEKRSLDQRHGSLEQDIRPAAHAALLMYWLPPSFVKQSGKATTTGGMAPDPISRSSRSGDVLAEILPVGVRRPAGGEADKIDEQRQPFAASRRHIDIDDALNGIAQQIAFQQRAIEDEPLDAARAEIRPSFACQIARVAFSSQALVSASRCGASVSRTRA